MTSFERKQPQHIFTSAGKKAFTLGIPITNNPYKEQPFKGLWEKGHRLARRKYEEKKLKLQRDRAVAVNPNTAMGRAFSKANKNAPGRKSR